LGSEIVAVLLVEEALDGLVLALPAFAGIARDLDEGRLDAVGQPLGEFERDLQRAFGFSALVAGHRDGVLGDHEGDRRAGCLGIGAIRRYGARAVAIAAGPALGG